MAEHTPGPWRLAKQPPNIGLTVTLYGYGPKTLGTIHTGSDEYIANAHLIAAAPDLMEALRGLYNAAPEDLSDGNSEAWQHAYAAIAKATGRTAAASTREG